MAKLLGVSAFTGLAYHLKFNDCFGRVKNAKSYHSLVGTMTDLYKLLRNYGYESFNFGTSVYYDKMLNKTRECEERLANRFILESKPMFIYEDELFENVEFESLCDEEKLDYLVWIARRQLLEVYHSNDHRIQSLDRLHLTNDCEKTSRLIGDLCNCFGLENRVIKIPAAFNDDINLYDGCGYHYFTIVFMNQKAYLIDCTYRQFFKGQYNNLERLGVVGLGTCDPGVFMTMKKSRKDVATFLLKNGWIELNEHVFKQYLDGFALSFRNGHYYELFGRVDYSTTYTIDNYLDFLTGRDTILNYEDREGLGILEEPLTNRNLRFNK